MQLKVHCKLKHQISPKKILTKKKKTTLIKSDVLKKKIINKIWENIWIDFLHLAEMHKHKTITILLIK